MKSLSLFILLVSASISVGQIKLSNGRVNTNEMSEILPITSHKINASDFKELESLKKYIGDAQVVLLGESDHNIGSFIIGNTLLVKFLHQEMGFDYLLFESGFYDLHKANKKIQMGESVIENVQSSIYSIWSATQEFEELTNYIDEQKLKIGGYDYSGAYLYPEVEGDLQYFLPKSFNSDILKDWIEVFLYTNDNFKLPEKEVLDSFYKANTKIKKVILANSNKNNSADEKQQQRFWLQLIKSQEAFIAHLKKVNFKTITKEEWTVETSQPRDNQMADNILHIISEYPNSKFICWGATGHFINNADHLEDKNWHGFKSIGYQLKKELGEDQVFIIGSTGVAVPKLHKESIEKKLSDQNIKQAIIPLKNENSSFYAYALGTKKPFKAKWNKVVDALCFVGALKSTTKLVSNQEFNDSSNESLDLPNNDQRNFDSIYIPQKEIYIYKLISGQNNLSVFEGKIIDSVTKEGIPFAAIGCAKYGIGAVADEKGDFIFKFPESLIINQDTLTVSCLGYQKNNISLTHLKANDVITLKEKKELLPTITINAKVLTAKDILKQVLENFEMNYSLSKYSEDIMTRSRVIDEKEGKYYLIESLASRNDVNGYKNQRVPGLDKNMSIYHARISEIDTVTGSVISTSLYKNEFADKYKHIFGSFVDSPLNCKNYTYINRKRWGKFEMKVLSESESYIELLLSTTKTGMRNTLSLTPPLFFQAKLKINLSDFALVEINELSIYKGEFNPDRNYLNELPKEAKFVKYNTKYEKNGDKYYMVYTSSYNNYSLHNFHETILLNYYPDNLLELQEANAYLKNQEYNPLLWDNAIR